MRGTTFRLQMCASQSALACPQYHGAQSLTAYMHWAGGSIKVTCEHIEDALEKMHGSTQGKDFIQVLCIMGWLLHGLLKAC